MRTNVNDIVTVGTWLKAQIDNLQGKKLPEVCELVFTDTGVRLKPGVVSKMLKDMNLSLGVARTSQTPEDIASDRFSSMALMAKLIRRLYVELDVKLAPHETEALKWIVGRHQKKAHEILNQHPE